MSNTDTLKSWLKNLVKKKEEDGNALRGAIEDLLETLDEQQGSGEDNSQERQIIENTLNLSSMTVSDVMIPRADIVAIDVKSESQEILDIITKHPYSRYPVFRNTLDDVMGTIHIKDIVATLAKGQNLNIRRLIREAPLVSPSLSVINLVTLMRQQKKHLVFIVDEYGGIDGLATIGDLVEAMIGDVADEYEAEETPNFIESENNTIIADGRTPIEEFEEKFGTVLDEEQREEIDTIAGYLSAIAGRVPGRGELIEDDKNTFVYEILAADPRRVSKIRIRPSAAWLKTQQEKADDAG